MKIALCFFGEARTASYTAPWFNECVKGLDLSMLGVCLKLEAYEPNSMSNTGKYQVKSRDLFDAYTSQPSFHEKAYFSLVNNFSKLDPKKGYWHFSRLFWALNHSLQFYNSWARTHEDVDLLILSRPDCLLGPTPDYFRRWVRSLELHKYDLFTAPGVMKFNTAADYGLGIGDFALAGSPFALNMLLSNTIGAVVRASVDDHRRYHFGPNIYLKHALDDSGLHHQTIPLNVALVRSSADLSLPVLESFNYHEDFWKSDHKGIK